MRREGKPKVSVFVITYNHEKFISEAIESIVSQKTDFDFEIVIGEDFSKDRTRIICERYAAQYPEIIKLLPSDKNYGPMGNTIRTLNACNGEYIAMCEGDDYWTDPNKLQKQVGFLEANPEFSICFSAVEIKDEVGNNASYDMHFPKLEKDEFAIEDFILSEMNIIPTPTMVFRNELPVPLPAFFSTAMAGDTLIQLFAADKGKAKYFTEKLAVYRNHPGGITKSKETIEKGDATLISLLKQINKYFGFRYNTAFRQRFLSYAKMNLIYGAKNKRGIQKVKHYFKRMPDYLKYSDKINFKELAYYHAVLFFPFMLKHFKKP